MNDGKDVGSEFAGYEERKKDGKSRGIPSKASKIVSFLRENKDRAFHSVDIVKALEVRTSDVMGNMHRYERKGQVFIRGYQSRDQRSPFKKRARN